MSKPGVTPTPPKETSAAQTSSNYMTSMMNNTMGNMNEVGPYGSKTTTQTGTQTITDPYTGVSYEVPTYTTNVALDPAQQALLDQYTAGQTNMATAGAGLAEGLIGMENFSLDTADTEAYLAELGSQRLDPKFAADEEALQTDLINQGIVPGSEAYNQEMMRFGQVENDAYNQLYLTGNQQAANQLMAERQMQLAEVNSLMGGGSATMPSFVSPTGVSPMAPTNNAGIISAADQAAMEQWQQQQAMWGQTFGALGGLFGL